MGFLSPLLLALGVAVAVPIILHLFQRHQGPRVIFPALRYLRRAEKENARRIKLRQLLLMLLRVGAVALLALAAARPFARGAGSQHQPTAVAIVLDNSLSSGVIRDDRRLLDELEDRALASLEAAGPDDRFWLIRAGAPWEPALSGDPLQTAERVRATTQSAGAADLTAALAHARALLAAGAEGRATEIHLLSDLQRTNLGAALEDGDAGPPVIVWVPDEEPPANRAVIDVEVAGGFAPIAGERSTVAIRVEGGAAFGAADSVAVRLNLDGRIVAAGWATPGAAAVLPFPQRPAGVVAGWAETDADALRADDRRYFSLRVRQPPGVAVRGELPFVDDAFAVMERAGRLTRAPLDQAEVVLLPGADGIESITSGTAVILPPESALELPAANRRLGAAGLPWRFGAASGAGEARFALGEGTDELLQTLDRVRLTQVYTLTKEGAAPADSVLLALSDGTPWAVRGERPNGTSYIVLASPLSASATTLPTSAAMVPLLDRVIGAWASARAIDGAFAPGAEAPLPPGTTAVLRPDDVRERTGAATHYALGGEPGIYRALAGDSTLAVFAVNPPAWESQLARADARELASLLGAWDVQEADDPDEWDSEVYRERLGREIWRPLLLAALLILLIEAAVAAAGRLGAPRGTRGREAAVASERSPDLAGAGQETG
jgi:Aerotolerance regulator N-terminal